MGILQDLETLEVLGLAGSVFYPSYMPYLVFISLYGCIAGWVVALLGRLPNTRFRYVLIALFVLFCGVEAMKILLLIPPSANMQLGLALWIATTGTAYLTAGSLHRFMVRTGKAISGDIFMVEALEAISRDMDISERGPRPDDSP